MTWYAAVVVLRFRQTTRTGAQLRVFPDPGSGPGFAQAVGVGSKSAALLFGQSQADSAKGPLITVDALQTNPGGDVEA